MTRYVQMTINGIAPIGEVSDGSSVIAGSPRFRSWSLDEARGGLSSGIWEATPGKWRFENSHWEYCRILSGTSIVIEDGGEPHRVKAGDSVILRTGFRGTWEVIETTRKDYVIRT